MCFVLHFVRVFKGNFHHLCLVSIRSDSVRLSTLCNIQNIFNLKGIVIFKICKFTNFDVF